MATVLKTAAIWLLLAAIAQATPALEGFAQAIGISGTSVVVDKPTGTVDGSLLVAHIVTRGSSVLATHTTPSGWTLVGSQARSTVRISSYWLLAGASEPASYTLEWSDTNQEFVCTIARWSGHDETTPINVQATGQGESTTVTCPTVTTTVDDCAINRLAAVRGASLTAEPAGTTEVWNTDSSGGAGKVSSGNATQTQASAGATGTAAWTSASALHYVTQTIAIAPGEAAAGASEKFPIVISF